MKHLFKRIGAIGLIVLFALSLFAFAACDPTPEEPETLVYSVTVVNENDAPVSGVRVRFGNYHQTTGTDGKASIELEAKEYKITLMNLPEGYTYSAEIILTPELHEVQARLVKGEGEPDPVIPVDPNAKRTYTVTVLYPDNTPVTGVEVQLCSDMGCKLPVAVNDQGKASLLTEPDNYHVMINKVPSGYTYPKNSEGYYAIDGQLVELTPTKTSMTVTLESTAPKPAPENTEIDVKGGTGGTYSVTVQGTEVYAQVNFVPSRSGIYSISSDTQTYDAKVGYFPWRFSTAGWDELSDEQRNDNVSATDKNFRFTVEIKQDELFDTEGKSTSSVWTFRIFVNAKNADGSKAIFPAAFDVKIVREGDVVIKPQEFRDAPVPENLTKFDEQEGTLTALPMDGSANLVFNESDGFYHLNAAEGSVVTVLLAKSLKPYYEPSFIEFDKEIDGIPGNNSVYRFDITPEENKDDITKPTIYLDYRMMLRGSKEPLTGAPTSGYAAYVNNDGVYGLTEELKEFLQRFASTYDAINWIGGIKKDATEDCYWLFACYYYDTSASTPA